MLVSSFPVLNYSDNKPSAEYYQPSTQLFIPQAEHVLKVVIIAHSHRAHVLRAARKMGLLFVSSLVYCKLGLEILSFEGTVRTPNGFEDLTSFGFSAQDKDVRERLVPSRRQSQLSKDWRFNM